MGEVAMALETGDELHGKRTYKIRGIIADEKAGFSIVYVATIKDSDEWVAIKELDPDKAKGFGELAGIQARFRQDAAVARALQNSPYIVRIIEDFPKGDTYYIVMPHAEDTLNKRLGKMSLSEAVETMIQICAGMKNVHSMEVVHCDIKPGNILFDKTGHVIITDFGIAHVPPGKLKRVTATEIAPFRARTRCYAPPEQERDKKPVRNDPRVDIYAMGVTFFMMLTKGEFDPCEIQNPESAKQCLRQHKVPERLIDIVCKATSEDMKNRYANAGEMLAALQKYTLSVAANGQMPKVHLPTDPISPDPRKPPVEPSNAPERSKPKLWFAIAAVLAGAAMVIIIFMLVRPLDTFCTLQVNGFTVGDTRQPYFIRMRQLTIQATVPGSSEQFTCTWDIQSQNNIGKDGKCTVRYLVPENLKEQRVTVTMQNNNTNSEKFCSVVLKFKK
jgi:serine/threonine protein kinase